MGVGNITLNQGLGFQVQDWRFGVLGFRRVAIPSAYDDSQARR